MFQPLAGAALLVALVIATTTCARVETGQDPATGLTPQRTILSQGYSMLYTDARNIGRAELILYVKFESEEFDRLITGLSSHGKAMKKDLERIARDYPGVRIDLDPLPEMEKRKRFAVGRDRAIRFAPLGGRSQAEYERIMLISIFNGLNHESHLCQVLAAEEPEPGLKKFLLESEQRYRELSDLALDLLNREHFKSSVSPAPKH